MSGRGRPAGRPRGRPAASAGRGALRVVAGTHRGRRLDVPPGTATRPTSDRVREAVFNALASLDALDGARGVDPFAGSGALGIEALSRGAAQVTFADVDASALSVVRGNLAALELGDRARVVAGSGPAAVAAGGPWDLVLLDPPYAFEGWSALLDAVVDATAPGAVVVVESDREVALPAALHGVRTRSYGGTVVQFARRSGAPS